MKGFRKRWWPRIYVCRDVIMIMWLDYEIIIPRLFKGDKHGNY